MSKQAMIIPNLPLLTRRIVIQLKKQMPNEIKGFGIQQGYEFESDDDFSDYSMTIHFSNSIYKPIGIVLKQSTSSYIYELMRDKLFPKYTGYTDILLIRKSKIYHEMTEEEVIESIKAEKEKLISLYKKIVENYKALTSEDYECLKSKCPDLVSEMDDFISYS